MTNQLGNQKRNMLKNLTRYLTISFLTISLTLSIIFLFLLSGIVFSWDHNTHDYICEKAGFPELDCKIADSELPLDYGMCYDNKKNCTAREQGFKYLELYKRTGSKRFLSYAAHLFSDAMCPCHWYNFINGTEHLRCHTFVESDIKALIEDTRWNVSRENCVIIPEGIEWYSKDYANYTDYTEWMDNISKIGKIREVDLYVDSEYIEETIDYLKKMLILKGCEYSNGSYCFRDCCITEDGCLNEILGRSQYVNCNSEDGIWQKDIYYKDEECSIKIELTLFQKLRYFICNFFKSIKSIFI